MTRDEIIQQLRPLRRELVVAAETVVEDAAGPLPEKTQFSRLLNLCTEASCAEEIENYLRYQAGRKGSSWKRDFVRSVIDRISPILTAKVVDDDEGEQDRLRVEAWRLYATYLRRSHVWQLARADQGLGRRQTAGRRQERR